MADLDPKPIDPKVEQRSAPRDILDRVRNRTDIRQMGNV
jgi:hypothetical protein